MSWSDYEGAFAPADIFGNFIDLTRPGQGFSSKAANAQTSLPEANASQVFLRLILALKRIEGVGDQTARKFLTETGRELLSAEDPGSEFRPFARSALRPIAKRRDSGEFTPEVWKQLYAYSAEQLRLDTLDGVIALHYEDPRYPKQLRALKKFPPILYARGNLELLGQPAVAFVGTRRSTKLGTKIVRRMARRFALDDVVVVSGLSIGTNTAAHRGALDALAEQESAGATGPVKTIAVLGHSLDQPVYPPENTNLAEQIVNRGGLLVSTFEFGTIVRRQQLAARDEWESGIADGLIVCETDKFGKNELALQSAIKQHRHLGAIDFLKILHNLPIPDIPVDQTPLGEPGRNNQKYIADGLAAGLYDLNSIRTFEQAL